MGLLEKLMRAGTPLTTYPDNEDSKAVYDIVYGTNTSGLDDYYDVVFSVGGRGIEQWFEDEITLRHIAGWEARRISNQSEYDMQDWYKDHGGNLEIWVSSIEIKKKTRAKD